MASAEEEVFTTWTKQLDDAAVSIVYLCGELDASSAPTFLTDMQPLINAERSLVMDTHLLSYIDSTGLGAMFSIKQALARAGRGICIVGAHGLLSKIMQVTRADHEFHCYDNVDEAMTEYGSLGW